MKIGQIGEYQYPVELTFADALKIAEIAVTKYEDKMSNKDVAEALGYTIKNPNAISGYIFRKFDELGMFNVMRRERGHMIATDAAKEALDPYDPSKSQQGKAKAIMQMPIVKKAFTEWNGEIPQETAFPSKLVDLLSIPWQEAQKHAESLRKLFIEVFPYLKTAQLNMQTSNQRSQSVAGGVGGEISQMEQKQGSGELTLTARSVGFGFTKTLPFTHAGMKELRKLLDFLDNQATEEKKPTDSTKTDS